MPTLRRLVVSVLASLAIARGALAGDAGVRVRRLTVVDGGTGGSTVDYTAALDPGIQKGPDGDPGALDATLEVFYTDVPAAKKSRLDMPQGAGWTRNSGMARYVNGIAPTGGGVKSATINPGRVARITALALGETPATSIDLAAGGQPSSTGGVTAVLTVYNRVDGSLHRLCTRFATADGSKVSVKSFGHGSGHKLIATHGRPTDCTLPYDQDATWLCKPGIAVNQCFVNGLDATEIFPDNSTALEPHVGNEDQPYDCFYIYPTVDLLGPIGNHTDFSHIRFELDPLLQQAAPFNASCRIFAPLYRQITLGTFGTPDEEKYIEIAYRDVKAAFDRYLAEDNGGRNFVIMGHSQGTFMVTRLMQEEIDPSPALRARLIAALLLGGSVAVPEGQTVGGTFQNIPLCTSAAETGCVIAYRSYADGHPPAGGSNVVSPDGTDTACTNPAALGGGSAHFESYFLALPRQLLFRVAPDPGFGTPLVKYTDFYAGECVKDDHDRSYLKISIAPGPGDMRTNQINFNSSSLDPSFLGTHILDYSWTLGDLIGLVETKAAAMP